MYFESPVKNEKHRTKKGGWVARPGGRQAPKIKPVGAE
jgi:hypothetical protein